MTFRVVQWATGGVGKAAITAIANHPELELVGAWVHSSEKNGRDVGEILGEKPLGVCATTSTEQIYALEPDAVIYAPLLPNPDEIRTLLRAGTNVLTPLGWFYPDSNQSAEMRQACLDGQASLHGTGVDPGGATELFPVLFSAMSSGVTLVRAEEFSDIRTYNAPNVVRDMMGFGQSPERAEASPMLRILSGGFTQSVRMCLDTLEFGDAEIHSRHEVAAATAPIDSPIGTIEPGQVAGQRFHWDALVGDQVVVRVGVNWLMGADNLDPAWTFGASGERFEVEVRGDPNTFVTITGWHPATVEAGLTRNDGIAVTAAHLVNTVPYVCAADPGVATALDLPLVAGRAHPSLARGWT